jgi:hypothetical protein
MKNSNYNITVGDGGEVNSIGGNSSFRYYNDEIIVEASGGLGGNNINIPLNN